MFKGDATLVLKRRCDPPGRDEPLSSEGLLRESIYLLTLCTLANLAASSSQFAVFDFVLRLECSMYEFARPGPPERRRHRVIVRNDRGPQDTDLLAHMLPSRNARGRLRMRA